MRDDYEQSLVKMSEGEFYAECYKTQKESAIHHDNPKSEWHMKIDACWDAAIMRPGGDLVYNRAFNDFHTYANRLGGQPCSN